MSDFKPGDMVLVKSGAGEWPAIVTGVSATWVRVVAPGYSAAANAEPTPLSFRRSATRRLVTIDPEDRAAVERLRDLMDEAWSTQNSDHGFIPIAQGKGQRGNALQAALREFAAPTPAKPDEPTGLGAVVRDCSGAVWVRYRTLGNPEILRPWRENIAGVGGTIRRWADIDAIEVLSEGVEA